jgi:Recombinase zinc beta ribbon domain
LAASTSRAQCAQHRGRKRPGAPALPEGSIFCGGCGARLIYSRNRGRRGGIYEYFVCLNRHTKRRHCSRRYVKVSTVEAGVADFYRSIQLTPRRAAEIRASVLAELSAEREQAASDRTRGMQRLASLTSERKAVLQAHYANAMPLDLLKEEMDRLTRDMAAAKRIIKDASKTVDELEGTLQAALAVAGDCHQRYSLAPPHLRRQINQGFFTRLLIDQDGSVERAEMTEPFAQLLIGDTQATLGRAQNAPDTPGAVPATEIPGTTPGQTTGAQGGDRCRPANVLVMTLGNDYERTHGDLVTVGSKEAGLVPAVGFEPTLTGS